MTTQTGAQSWVRCWEGYNTEKKCSGWGEYTQELVILNAGNVFYCLSYVTSTNECMLDERDFRLDK